MDVRESLWKYSKSIGDVYGDLGAANRVGIVWIFCFMTGFFFHSDWEIHDPDLQTHPCILEGPGYCVAVGRTSRSQPTPMSSP